MTSFDTSPFWVIDPDDITGAVMSLDEVAELIKKMKETRWPSLSLENAATNERNRTMIADWNTLEEVAAELSEAADELQDAVTDGDQEEVLRLAALVQNKARAIMEDVSEAPTEAGVDD